MAIEPAELHTGRLLLRPFRPGDVEDVFGYSSDEKYAYFAMPESVTHAEMAKLLANISQTPWENDPRFAVVFERRVVGSVELNIDHTNSLANLGYGIAREYWGRGLATEAAQAVVNYGFRTFDLAKVFARADPRNLASLRVLEKLGMQREGLLRSHLVRRGERVDRVYYGLLREEWEASSSRGRRPTPREG